MHPLIARMFWGVGIESRIGFSPFQYCNGTARASLVSQHNYDYLTADSTYPDIFFVDFAGSGVVHLLALTVIFYHLGCYIEFICDPQDGAQIFPVRAVSGFWGLLCVGLFYKPCLIKEFYFATCFCEDFLEGSLRDLLDGNGRGYMFGYQLAGGLLIIALAVLFCTTPFFLLWLIPVKTIYYATGLRWIFCFPSEGRGACSQLQRKTCYSCILVRLGIHH